MSDKSSIYTSETSKCRERLEKFCIGSGVDLGYGGDPIVPTAITVDMHDPYSHVGNVPLHLEGDARNLYWFKDNSLDFVYSSHLLEDFPANETINILVEWLRVLVIGGHLILYLPDEQKFRKHCRLTGQVYNVHHSVEEFSLNYLKRVLKEIQNIEIIHENPACEQYSFEIVIKKTRKI